MHERLKAGAWALGGERVCGIGVLREYAPFPLDPVAGLQDDQQPLGESAADGALIASALARVHQSKPIDLEGMPAMHLRRV